MCSIPRVRIVGWTPKRIMISSDLHGNYADFRVLRELFETHTLHTDMLWISTGDWVHGPDEETTSSPDPIERALYAYEDRSADIVRELIELKQRWGDRFLTVLGNHDYAHIGGEITSKFHPDEAAFLESQMEDDEIARMKEFFESLPLLILIPSCGVVVTHGAPVANGLSLMEINNIHLGGGNWMEQEDFLSSVMTHYGFNFDGDVLFLRQLSRQTGQLYTLIVHGHDRTEDGYFYTGDAALMLCTSFGAVRSSKSYLWLSGDRTYSRKDLRLGVEIRRLYGTPPLDPDHE